MLKRGLRLLGLVIAGAIELVIYGWLVAMFALPVLLDMATPEARAALTAGLGVALTGLVAAGQLRIWRRLAWRDRLALAIRGTPLKALPLGVKRTVEAAGELAGLEARLRVQPVEGGQRLLVKITGLTPRLRLSTGDEPLEGEPVLVGDEGFDPRLYLSGDRAEALARFDAPARALLPDPELVRFKVEDGVLRAGVLLHPAEPEAVRAALLALAGLAERLREHRFQSPSERETALLVVARDDPSPEVRVRALEALLSSARDPVIRDQALALAQVLDDPRLALAVMRTVGGVKDPALLAALIRDPSLPRRIRLEALSVFPASGAVEQAPSLIAALRDEDALIRSAALRHLARIPPSSPALEPALLGLLNSTEAEEQEAVIRALGTAGGPQSVLPLKALAGELLGVGRRARLAREALRRVQARLVDAGAGALSVAEGEGGALSLARESGGLSLEESE